MNTESYTLYTLVTYYFIS